MPPKRNRRGHPLVLVALCGIAVSLAGCGGERRPADTAAVVDPPGESATPVTATAAPPKPTPTPPITPPRDAEGLEAEGYYREAAAAYEGRATAAGAAAAKSAALLRAGVSWWAEGEQDRAFDAWRQALSAAPAGSPEEARAAYILGRRLEEAGKHEEALTTLARGRAVTASPLLPLIQSHYALAAGHAAGPEEAKRAWEALASAPATPDDVRADAFAALSEAAEKAGQLDDAFRWAVRVVDLRPGLAARERLVALAASSGNTDAEAAQLRAIAGEFPRSLAALDAITRLETLGRPLDPGTTGFVHYRHGALSEAIKVLEPAAGDASLTAEARAFAIYYLAAAYEDSGDAAKAVESYDRAAATAPASVWAHRAAYWAARVLEGTGDASSASRRYVALRQASPFGEFAAEAAFRSGYTLFRAGDAPGAIGAWDAAAELDARGWYWKGRAQQLQGDSAGAAASFARAEESEPGSFYAFAAADRLHPAASDDGRYRPRKLRWALDWDDAAAWVASLAPDSPPVFDNTLARELAAVGLGDAAGDALLAGAPRGRSPWLHFYAMREATELGLHDIAARLAVRLVDSFGVQPSEVHPVVQRVMFPVPYVELVGQVAIRSGVDPLLLAALVRVESFWDPSAVSFADAYGLTQVIPPTGRAIAEQLGWPSFDPAQLLRPHVSLEFGATYLAGQLKTRGQVPPAVAAYNAGPGPIARWQGGGHETVADFVEAIDFNETRSYVALVLQTWAAYRAAYPDD